MNQVKFKSSSRAFYFQYYKCFKNSIILHCTLRSLFLNFYLWIFKGLVASCHSFCLFWYYMLHSFIPSHSYSIFIRSHSPRFLSNEFYVKNFELLVCKLLYIYFKACIIFCGMEWNQLQNIIKRLPFIERVLQKQFRVSPIVKGTLLLIYFNMLLIELPLEIYEPVAATARHNFFRENMRSKKSRWQVFSKEWNKRV